MIVASAIRLANGSIYVGMRHSDCHSNAEKILTSAKIPRDEINKLLSDYAQGFITDDLKFLVRDQAYYHAGRCNQLKNEEGSAYLISEDLW